MLLHLSCNHRKLDLGHLTALTRLNLTRSPEVCEEGWRDISAEDKLPPNLKALSVCNCLNATPLLALTSLEALLIGPHCHMPASQLQRLSAMTHLTHVELGYSKWRHLTGWDKAAQEGSAGWGFVPALHELHLHGVEINPVSRVLNHLSCLTSLTRLVWDGVVFMDRPRLHQLRRIGDVGPNDRFYWRDGGMPALGMALPHSLVSIEIRNVLPPVDRASDEIQRYGLKEENMLWGLMRLKEAVLALPGLSACTIDAHSETSEVYYSEKFGELMHALLGDDWRQPVPVGWGEELDRTYPGFLMA